METRGKSTWVSALREQKGFGALMKSTAVHILITIRTRSRTGPNFISASLCDNGVYDQGANCWCQMRDAIYKQRVVDAENQLFSMSDD